jgi:hypothetical protein
MPSHLKRHQTQGYDLLGPLVIIFLVLLAYNFYRQYQD